MCPVHFSGVDESLEFGLLGGDVDLEPISPDAVLVKNRVARSSNQKF
jgi:hypothetical protein